MLTSKIDPHWSAPPGFEQCREADEASYQAAEKFGVEFRGFRFWPPFFCFTCGLGISANQWLFSRSCGGCDCSLGIKRQQATGALLDGAEIIKYRQMEMAARPDAVV